MFTVLCYLDNFMLVTLLQIRFIDIVCKEILTSKITNQCNSSILNSSILNSSILNSSNLLIKHLSTLCCAKMLKHQLTQNALEGA